MIIIIRYRCDYH